VQDRERLSIASKAENVFFDRYAHVAAKPLLKGGLALQSLRAPYPCRLAVKASGRAAEWQSLVLPNPIDAVALLKRFRHDAKIDAISGADDDRDRLARAFGIADRRGRQRSKAGAR
jgi:hypothetical protein